MLKVSKNRRDVLGTCNKVFVTFWQSTPFFPDNIFLINSNLSIFHWKLNGFLKFRIFLSHRVYNLLRLFCYKCTPFFCVAIAFALITFHYSQDNDIWYYSIYATSFPFISEKDGMLLHRDLILWGLWLLSHSVSVICSYPLESYIGSFNIGTLSS